MIQTLIIHQPSDPYSDCDFRNTEDQPKVFDNPCPTCGKSLDYEGKINDMCECVEQTHLKAEQAMSKLKKIDIEVRELSKI